MNSLDFAAMENIQGGTSGTISINFPVSSLLSGVGLSSLLGVSLGFGVTVGYNLDSLTSVL